MMTVEQIRHAALTQQPWSRLDEIVRAEMATARKVKDIAHEYQEIALALHSDEENELPEDSDDALMDTLDALRGTTHSKDCYRDPPNISLPSEEEIAALPRWARVALAARCARRVVPLFVIDGSDVDSRENPGFRSFELGRIIGALERSAELAKDTTLIWHLSNWAYGESAPPIAASVGNAVYFAANALREPNHDTGYSYRSSAASYDAAIAIGADLIQVSRRDFDKLAALAKWQKWTDDTPVPATVFGPLWPEGPPMGWPANPELPQRSDLGFELAAKEGLPDSAIEDEVVNLFNTINRYYIARGGQPLDLEDFQPLVSVLELVEV